MSLIAVILLVFRFPVVSRNLDISPHARAGEVPTGKNWKPVETGNLDGLRQWRDIACSMLNTNIIPGKVSKLGSNNMANDNVEVAFAARK